MSLTQLLSKKDIKERFRQEFKMPKTKLSKELLAPPITKHYALVGTAFDYLLRFNLERIDVGTSTSKWIAENAPDMIARRSTDIEITINADKRELQYNDNDTTFRAKKLIAQAKENKNQFLSTGKITDELLGSTLILAQLDIIFRTGRIDIEFGCIDPGDIQDLKNIYSITDFDLLVSKQRCILNPSFDEASKLVGGADADLLIDNMLIDIKTTKLCTLKRDYFNQLIGYYVLTKIRGADGKANYANISKLGVYFSRFAYLHLFEVKDFINDEKLSHFVAWFMNRAAE